MAEGIFVLSQQGRTRRVGRLGIGDFNGDARADVAWKNGTTGQGEFWLMDSGTVGQKVEFSTAGN